MGRGGSEATAMWTLQALQDRSDLTFTTASDFDLGDLNRTYQTRVSPEKVSFLPAPGLPGFGSGSRLVHWRRSRFERHCRRIANRFDLCLSAYNPIDFGRPAIQLIGDFSFSEKSRLLLYPNAEDRFCHRQSLLRLAYLSVGECLQGWRRPPLAERGDCTVANSAWTAEKLERIFRLTASPVLYPPCPAVVSGTATPEVKRDPLAFICLGRVSPEKEIESAIAILERVRHGGYPVTLTIAGGIGDDAYGRRIARLIAARRQWIRSPGFLEPEQKVRLFAQGSFAIHACRVEAFGIGVAEMAAAGIIPFVPADGGPSEIVALDELIYAGGSDAVGKIVALLEKPESHPQIRTRLQSRVSRFRPDDFISGLATLIGQFLDRPLPTPTFLPLPTPHVDKNLAATR